MLAIFKLYTHPTYFKVLQLITKTGFKERKLRILDFGCGSGYFYNIFPKNRLKSYVGFDVSIKAIKEAKRFKRSSAEFRLINKYGSLNLGAECSQDLVVAIGVLQYLTPKQIEEFILEAGRVLAKNGVLIISTVSDHLLYKIINLYKLFLTHDYINRERLERVVRKNGFFIEFSKEMGLLLGPLVSHNLTLIPDALDKLLFSTQGTLGFFGKGFRKLSTPIMALEYFVPMDVGYTLILKAKKR